MAGKPSSASRRLQGPAALSVDLVRLYADLHLAIAKQAGNPEADSGVATPAASFGDDTISALEHSLPQNAADVLGRGDAVSFAHEVESARRGPRLSCGAARGARRERESAGFVVSLTSDSETVRSSPRRAERELSRTRVRNLVSFVALLVVL